jgi:chromosome segregation ATPase
MLGLPAPIGLVDPYRPTLIIMSMQAESLEVLEKADVAPAQARAIVRAIEIELAGAKDTLATKHDLLLQRQDLHNEMSGLRTGLQNEMSELRAELKGEMSELRAELKGEMSELRAELRAEMSELRGELRAEIHASASTVTRQMYGALLGQMAVLLGFAYFFATHIR